jgi:hypothetical protein
MKRPISDPKRKPKLVLSGVVWNSSHTNLNELYIARNPWMGGCWAINGKLYFLIAVKP